MEISHLRDTQSLRNHSNLATTNPVPGFSICRILVVQPEIQADPVTLVLPLGNLKWQHLLFESLLVCIDIGTD